MSTKKARNESMLFNYETTYRTGYRDFKFKNPVKISPTEKRTCLMVRPPPVKDIHTFTDWKQRVPFNVLHKPNDVHGINPRDVQKAYNKAPDLERELVQQTRPRLVMTPAIRVDDIEDGDLRDILIKDTYTSDMTRSTTEAVAKYFNVKAPLPGLPAPANPMALPKLRPPYVPPEWRMESVGWDREQLRTYCDPDKRFWMAHQPTPCEACDNTAAVEAQRKLLREMKQKSR